MRSGEQQSVDHLLLFALTIVLCVFLSTEQASAAGLDFPPADFNILSADGSHVIGHGNYRLSADSAGIQIVHGEDRYLSGDYDIEQDRLELRDPHKMPVMISSEHTFYRPDGSVERMNKADFRSGEASCGSYQRGKVTVDSATLDFPPDTFAGPVVVVPLQQFLRARAPGPMALHVFNCIPGPKVLQVKAYPKAPATWEHYPGRIVQVDVKPDFGWLNLIVAPFVPEIHAWFDPSWNSHFVGGEFTRFYKGPQIILARVPTAAADKRAGSGDAAPATESRGVSTRTPHVSAVTVRR
jgi:hypothetical protein